MSRLTLTFLLGTLLCLCPAAQAAPPRLSPLPPMKLAQAEQAPEGTVPPSDDKAAEDGKDPRPAPPPLFVPPLKPGGCRADRDCARSSLCEDGSCVRPQRSVSALFYFYKPGATGYRMVVPFYFSFWRPGAKTRVLVPFFGWHKDEEQHKSDLILPLFLYRYHKEPGAENHQIWPIFFYSNYGAQGAAAGLLPLFYARRRGPESLAVLPPLLSFYFRDKSHQAHDMLWFGLVYSHKRGDASVTVVPPILSYFRQKGDSAYGQVLLLAWYHHGAHFSRGGLFPLIWHFGNDHGQTTVALPLFFAGEDRERGRRFISFLPFFHYQRDDKAGTRLVMTPLGGQYTDTVNQTRTSVVLVPPLIHRDEPLRQVTVLPPLAVFWHNKETGTYAGYVGPAFWSRSDEGSTVGLLPIYFRFHDRRTDGTTHVLLPIAALHHSPARVVGFFGPLYGWSVRPGPGRERSSGGGLFPLFMYGSGAQSHVALLPPLFIYASDREAGSRHVSVGPVFFRSHQSGPFRGYDAGILPLLFFGCRAGTSYQVLLPLFFHSKGPRVEHLVLGPLFVNRTFARQPGDPDAGVSAGIFPILWVKSTPAKSHAVIPPLLWFARDGRKSVGVIGPIFWHRQPGPGGRGQQVSGGVLPLVYVQTTRGTDHDGTVVVTPIGGYRSDPQRRFLLLGPFVHAEQKLGPDASGAAMPAPGSRSLESSGRAVTDALLPIAFFYRSPQRSAQVIFPLYWQGRDGQSTVRSALLLYYGISRPGLSAHVLFPLIWRVATLKSSTTVLGPLFYHHRYDGKSTAVGFLPLFGYGHTERATTLVTPIGFYHHDRKDERTRTFFALFYGDFQKGRADYGLFPLFFGTRRGTASAWLAPLLYHSSDPAQDRSLTVLGPLYFGHRGAATYGGFAPIFFGRNEGNGSYRFTMAPLFHFDHRAGSEPRTRLFTPLFGFVKNPTGYRAYLLPFYLRRDGEARSEAVLPIFYHTWDPRTDVSTTLVLPLYYRHRTPQSSLTAVTPLFWQYNTLTRSVAFAFPLVLDVHDLFHQRLTAAGPVVPLFIRKRNYAENTTTWIFPPLLTYVKRHGDGHHDAVVFPIFWHYGGKERSTTILFPLFWHLRRPTYAADVAIPLFIRYRDENASTLVIPPLLTYVKKQADGHREVVVFPLFWHSSDQRQSKTVLIPLFAYWKNERARHVLVLNTYTSRGYGTHQGEWSFHFWPLFSVGHPRKQDLEWNVFGGLVGYARVRDLRTLRLLWGIFIPLDRSRNARLRRPGGRDLRLVDESF